MRHCRRSGEPACELKENLLSTKPHCLKPELSGLEDQIPALRRYAQKLARNPDDAADIVQMCLERALRNSQMFRPGTNLRAWLFAILHNEFISEIRRRARRGQAVPLDEWVVPATDGGQENALELSELIRAFGKLGFKDRQVLNIVGVEGSSYAAAGIHLKIEIGTVKSRVFRARDRLRALLGDDDASRSTAATGARARAPRQAA